MKGFLYLSTKELLWSARVWHSIPYLRASEISRWLGYDSFSAIKSERFRIVSFLKTNAVHFRGEQDDYFDLIALFLLTFHLKRRHPAHFAEACRILVDYLEYNLRINAPLGDKLKFFSGRPQVLTKAGLPLRRYLRKMGQRLEVSEGTLYRWRRIIKAGASLESKYREGARRRRAREFLPRVARILEFKKAGFSTRQAAETLSLSMATVRRVYRKADRLAGEIARPES